MLEILEKVLKEMERERKLFPNTPEKYLKLTDNRKEKLRKDIDKIYREYSKLRQLEEKIAKKYDIETN